MGAEFFAGCMAGLERMVAQLKEALNNMAKNPKVIMKRCPLDVNFLRGLTHHFYDAPLHLLCGLPRHLSEDCILL